MPRAEAVVRDGVFLKWRNANSFMRTLIGAFQNSVRIRLIRKHCLLVYTQFWMCYIRREASSKLYREGWQCTVQRRL